MSTPLCKSSTGNKRSYHFTVQCDDAWTQSVFRSLVALGNSCLKTTKHGMYNFTVQAYQKTIHFVVSCNKSGQVVNHIKGLTREVDRSPVDFHVAIGDKATIKGKPFTRVTQKLLAWGNLDATKEDTRCKICDKPALKQCSCKEAWCRDCCVIKGIPVVVHMQENKLQDEINEPFCVNVSEYTKMSNEEKLEYMRLEIGDNEDLLTFASKYLELFKEKVKGVNNQKQYCLQLYREYAKVHELQEKGPYNTLEEARKMSYSCVSHVPPHLQGEFERLWDALAQDCCLECGTAVPKDVDYCSKACAHASMIVACGRVDPNGEANEEGIHLCKGNLELIGKVYACQKCGHNKDYKDTPSPSSSSCPFDAIIARHKENDVAVRNMWVIKKRSADHVPEWTKRRRT